MTDVTDTYLTNAGFETDVAVSDLTSATNNPTGWTVSPTDKSYTQWGTANSSTTIQGNSTSQAPSAGDNYFYFRNNWNNNVTFSISQDSKAQIPAGQYIIYVDAYTYSSNSTQPAYTFTVENGSTTYVNGSLTANTKAWTTYYYHFNLTEDATLTFKATITPKSEAGSKNNWLLLDNIRLLKADNPQTPVANNTTDLYLRNEATGLYLSAGQTWGTHATVDNYGQEITAGLNNGVYTLKTQQYDKYVGGLYMDSGSANWLFLEAETGKYYLTQDGYNYMTSNGAGAEVINVTSPTANSVWTIVSKADRKTALSSASVDTPINATFLLPDPNFGRNNVAYSNWTWTFPNGENKDNAGNNDNFVVECYHKQFTFKTTLAAGTAPAGVYGLTAQGFYRQDGSDNDNLPVFFANNEEQTFPARTGSEGSMNAASTSFSSGLYTIDPIFVRIEDTDAFEVGAKLATNEALWCIWDNFQLTYYGDVTIAAVKMKASVDAYNAAMTEAQAFTESSMFAADWSTLQAAITANTLDLNDPGLTESALTTATANLVAANTAATAAVNAKTTYDTAVSTISGGTNIELTSLITNPGFETGNTNGWNNDGAITANAQDNSSFDNKQGTYYAERWHVSGTIDINQTVASLPAGIYKIEAYMYSDVNDAKLYVNSTEVSVSTSGKYTATVEIADKGSIKMGASCTLTNSTWICLDAFTLTYIGTVNDLTYTLATGKMGTDKSAAQSAAETTFSANKTLANYNALLTAITEAEASVANYATLKTAIDKAEAVKAANNFVTAAATTALENEISTATTAWNDVTYTDAEATAEIATLGSAVSGWHAIDDSGKAGAFMASTWGKTHENWFEAPYINTWSTEGDNDGSGFSVPFFEYYDDANKNLAAKTFTATLTGLANGCYEVQIWARAQRRSDADFNGDNSMITMSVNGGDAVSIMSNTGNNVGSGTNVMRLGRYTARGMVTDGTLTLSIDVKLGSNVHWLSWRDVKYTKLDEASLAITDAEWATFVAPFDVTIPDGVTAYNVTGEVDGTLTLEEVPTTILANKPVLLYKDEEVSETVYGKAEATAATNGLLTGVYAETPAPDDSYVLAKIGGKVAFYQVDSESKPTITANRCYLIASSPARALYFPGNEGTGIEAVNALTSGDSKIFNASGAQIPALQKGLNIVKQSNGKSYKVIVK